MAELVRCSDRNGRVVVLTDEIWVNHIIDRHPEFTGLEACIEMAITDPYRVTQDARHSNRECMYRHRTLPGNLSRFYLKVVVAFQPSGPNGILVGTVLTAFATDRIKSTERQLWP